MLLLLQTWAYSIGIPEIGLKCPGAQEKSCVFLCYVIQCKLRCYHFLKFFDYSCSAGGIVPRQAVAFSRMRGTQFLSRQCYFFIVMMKVVQAA